MMAPKSIGDFWIQFFSSKESVLRVSGAYQGQEDDQPRPLLSA